MASRTQFKETTMTINNLQEKMAGQLALVYYSEQQFVEAQAKMAAAATDPALKAGITKHVEETKAQVETLEHAFLTLGKQPKAEKCPICDGLVAAGETGMKSAGNDAIRDVNIGTSIGLVENYEIAAYRGLVAQAQTLGRDDIAQMFSRNLQQEEHTAQQAEAMAPALMQKAV
jgi:ferritin-like metal-binding protein YciE